MKSAIIWKLVISAVVVAWALLSLLPVQDTPYQKYLVEEASANQKDLQQFLDRADDLRDRENINTPFKAILTLANRENMDLHRQFYPHVDLISVPKLPDRNETLLKYLYSESQGNLKLGLDLAGGLSITLRIKEDPDLEEGNLAQETRLEEAVAIMSDRINAMGLTEPIIRPIPPNSLQIQLPGQTGLGEAVIGTVIQPARLEFRDVHRFERPSEDAEVGNVVTLPVNPNNPDVVARYEVMEYEDIDGRSGEVETELYYVKTRADATGEIVQSSRPAMNEYGNWIVSLDLTGSGSDRFAEMTGRMLQEVRNNEYRIWPMMGIVLDGNLQSVVGLNSEDPQKITGGRVQITGNFTQDEVFQLANVLNNPLKYELSVAEMTEVGPSMAEDAQKASINAALIGAVLVVIFMLAYYIGAGLVAVITVMLNLIVVVGTLAGFEATLTLPGVAALVLTIGMAVDANILIFERIREELRAGKSVENSLKNGFDKVFSTIIDANVTTLITAIILVVLGTGPVKGFGITLAIGIGASVFGALIITRAFLELLVLLKVSPKLFLPMRMKKGFSGRYLQYRTPAFVSAWMLVLLGVATLWVNQDHILGIDFRGGTKVEFSYEEGTLNTNDINVVAEQQNLGEVRPLFESTLTGDDQRLVLEIANPDASDDENERLEHVREVVQSIVAAFPEANLEELGQEQIGGSVSAQIKQNALLAVACALVGILLYVALRFEIGFGVGAVVATVHDVLMSIGVFIICGQIFGLGSGQFNSEMIAAVLMIVGYSINDTIVVFDRIREELELHEDMRLYDVINLAIGRTLSRTILTSITTGLAALALYIFAVDVIVDFALIFLIGILTGTFSSIFIASPIFYWYHRGDRKHVTEHEFSQKPVYEWEALPEPSAKSKS